VTRILTEADVQQLLTMPMAMERVEQMFIDRAHGEAFDVPRRRTRQPGGHLHILQGAAPKLNVIGYKAYYVKPAARTFYVHLIDRERGTLEAMIEADWMGRMRTGAATGVAAKYMAREDAHVLGLFGSGRHAMTQLEALCLARTIRLVKVYGRDRERVARFCAEMGPRTGTEVRPAASREETVRGSDMVVTMTRATEPLFDGAWLEPGTFVAAAGANALDRREIDLATVLRSEAIVVDSREVAAGECGDLLPAIEQGSVWIDHLADLGEVIVGRRRGRPARDSITLYESHGMALQDLYVGKLVLDLARERGISRELELR
jgi:ornithine cyclodeaminase